MNDRIVEDLRKEALEMGFGQMGITSPAAIRSPGGRLREWVAEGHHGEMSWMADRIDWRASPADLWPDARSVIMLADSYAPQDDPLATLSLRDKGAISVYARGKDYHDVVKKRLKRLGRWLIDRAGPTTEIKVFVDTAPVMEKPLAAAAGLGWQGKHTNLVSRELGSWFFLGAIFTTLDLPEDETHVDRCGDCRRCLDICPTAAFPAPYRLDARRCISYLTIELKGPIPRAFRSAIGNRIYGCDDCLAVCPWNKFASDARDAYRARPETDTPSLADLVMLDDTAFRTLYRGSPIKRIGRARFVRNVLIAIGNSGLPDLKGPVISLLDDPEPLVRGAAVWALSRLAPERLIDLHRDDPDPDVTAEWDASLLERSMP